MDAEESAGFIERHELESHIEIPHHSYKNLPDPAEDTFIIAEVCEFQLDPSDLFEELANLFLLLNMPHSADLNSTLNIDIHLN